MEKLDKYIHYLEQNCKKIPELSGKICDLEAENEGLKIQLRAMQDALNEVIAERDGLKIEIEQINKF